MAMNSETLFSMDLSPAFIVGAAESFPEAEITFDRFHVVKILNGAMNQVRIVERKEHDAQKDQYLMWHIQSVSAPLK